MGFNETNQSETVNEQVLHHNHNMKTVILRAFRERLGVTLIVQSSPKANYKTVSQSTSYHVSKELFKLPNT